MKTIPLTMGKFAMVDDEDFEYLNQFNWSCGNRGYAVRGIRSRKLGTQTKIIMHRVIMNAPKGMEVDHVDGNMINNQKANLRLCTHQENLRNQKVKSTNKTGFRGVFFNKSRNKWDAQIKLGGKSTYIGRFKTPIEAAVAWNEVASKNYGQFARLNPI